MGQILTVHKCGVTKMFAQKNPYVNQGVSVHTQLMLLSILLAK